MAGRTPERTRIDAIQRVQRGTRELVARFRGGLALPHPRRCPVLAGQGGSPLAHGGKGKLLRVQFGIEHTLVIPKAVANGDRFTDTIAFAAVAITHLAS